ncbi:MAG TPA: hypothetical protein VIF09_03515 [Polyangiaceae bacterium]|jgi:hypothetical protein
MSARAERLLMLVAPVAAMATVALGLRLGAGNAVRAAVVQGAPLSGAGTGLAWQVVVFDEERGYREPVALPDVEVAAWQGSREVQVGGATNVDGAMEVLLPLSAPADRVEVRVGGALLAGGDVVEPAVVTRKSPATAWTRFSRREGAVVLDVAVLGQRVATGFPATLWIHATDTVTRGSLPGVVVEPERDESFVPGSSSVTTDARGWARIVATPVGHVVAVVLRARTPDGRTGVWAGGLFVSPGAAQLSVNERVTPDEEPVLDVVVPTLRDTAYLEIDDAKGRAWAAAVPVKGAPGQMPRATVHAPRLAPGLYWAVEAGDPVGGSLLGPGTIARPFFVAASDIAALSYGLDADACAPPLDPRDTARAVSVCLGIAGAAPVPRWTALEGFSMQHARDAQRRRRGLALALGGLLVAGVLEVLLLLRASVAARAKLRAQEAAVDAGPVRFVGRPWSVGVGLLVALLGFALLAAFLGRVG